MSYEFFNHRLVVGRKQHICEQCRRPISVGEKHVYCVGRFDGYFVTYREHEDCRDAWTALHNELRDDRWEDAHPFLADDDFDVGEREWVHEKFPKVAERVWPKLVWGLV